MRVFHLLFCLVCFTGALFSQEQISNDYFAKIRDERLVYNVERYHLTSSFPELYRAKEYGYALGDITFILRYFPNHPKALLLLGHVAILLNRPLLPLDYFKKAISLYPQYPITHVQFAEYLLRIDQIDSGIQQLNVALRLDPNYALAHALLADAYQKQGKSELSKQEFQKAKELGFVGGPPETIDPVKKITPHQIPFSLQTNFFQPVTPLACKALW